MTKKLPAVSLVAGSRWVLTEGNEVQPDLMLLDFVIKQLVEYPEDVRIERTIDEKGVLLELTVNPVDLGRVIGKQGANAQAMRTLLRALGSRNDARYNLKITDNGKEAE